LKSNKNWYVIVFKCLDHDEMIECKMCMSKHLKTIKSSIHVSMTQFIHVYIAQQV